MATKYSLTTLLNDLLTLQNSSYETISKLSEIVSSNSDTVTFTLPDSNNVLQQITIPSFGAIKQQLLTIENNIKSLGGITDSNAKVQLSDGSFRPVLLSNLKKEANDIASLGLPTTFNKKENWFFESFLNPLLYIKFNLDGQVKTNTEAVEVVRYLLNLDSDEKVQIFRDNFLGQTNIRYQDFIQLILDNNITFFLDKDVVTLPPKSLRYWGNFAVTNIIDDTLTETVDGVSYNKRVLRLQLDKLVYNDRDSKFLGTQSLKVGHSLLVNSGQQNTRYKIVGIDSTTRSVSVQLVEGFDTITYGVDSLSFYDENANGVSVDINIGFNESCVIFIKPIDPDSKIAAVNWSPGVGLYTNDLTIVTDDGISMSLANYYQEQVVDFGSYLYSMAKDKITPSTLGVDPNVPLLNATDFQVVQINDHLTSSGVLNDLKKLQTDKLRVQGQIATLDASIKDLRTKVQTTKYSSQKLEDTDRTKLRKLIDEKVTQSALFTSIIDDITKISNSQSVDDLKPKYRVRGFFPMPEPKTTERTGDQNVVQFAIQYRYVKKDGSANSPQQISFTDNTGEQRRGSFSTWIELKSDVRKRTIDPITGQGKWDVEDVEDADIVNINQIDIPIQSGEGVEFRVRSLSEAGWPINPKMSNWSDIIRIDFPDTLDTSFNALSIVEEAKKQSVRVELESSLQSLGIEQHVSSSFTQNQKYYAHTATEIASGFLTSEQNVISLFEKLTALDNELAKIKALVESTLGVLVVRVVDEFGNEYDVKPNTTLRIFAGNYRDEVANLSIKKGAILTKNYYIKLTNSSASTLELYARLWGDKYTKAQESFITGAAFNANDTDYNKIRRYDYVPIGLVNPSSTDIATYGFIRQFPDQSSQVMGQFLNCRYLSIDGTTPLYGAVSNTSYGVYPVANQLSGTPLGATASSVLEIDYSNLSTYQDAITTLGVTGSTASGDFVWMGELSASTTINAVSWNDPQVQSAYPNAILVHVLHPDIPLWQSGTDPNDEAQYGARNSIFANVQNGSSGSNLQSPLFYESVGATSDRYAKIGFEANDQYLLGPLSVGAYLFLNPNTHTDLRVNGNDSLAVKSVAFGNNNALTIPITFQYRMTDFFGDGTSGLGNVAGNPNANSSTNVEYRKTIGIDIYNNLLNKERFSFDVEVSARYYSKSAQFTDIPARSFEAAIDDLNQTIKNIQPTSSRNVGSK